MLVPVKYLGCAWPGGRLITISFVVLRSLADLFISGVSWFGFIFFFNFLNYS